VKVLVSIEGREDWKEGFRRDGAGNEDCRAFGSNRVRKYSFS
jgi:hypothetical protein